VVCIVCVVVVDVELVGCVVLVVSQAQRSNPNANRVMIVFMSISYVDLPGGSVKRLARARGARLVSLPQSGVIVPSD